VVAAFLAIAARYSNRQSGTKLGEGEMKEERAACFAKVVLDYSSDERTLKIQLDNRTAMESVAKALELEGCRVERDRIKIMLTVTRPDRAA
jgi:hypothetical protein